MVIVEIDPSQFNGRLLTTAHIDNTYDISVSGAAPILAM